MADGTLHYPYMLVDGDREAMEFIRGVYDPSAAAADQYEQGDLVFIDGTDNAYVKKATTVGASLPLLLLAGQSYDEDDLNLPPNDGSSPHWFYGRGVPCNKIPEKHEFVFTVRGGSGAGAADETAYDITAADLIDIQEGAEVELYWDTVELTLVVDIAATSNPNVQLVRTLERDVAAGDTDISVVVRILPDFIRK
jgi:acetylornithine deacetylase/succinyl-diaminopimelate desuccinylase-like protein